MEQVGMLPGRGREQNSSRCDMGRGTQEEAGIWLLDVLFSRRFETAQNAAVSSFRIKLPLFRSFRSPTLPVPFVVLFVQPCHWPCATSSNGLWTWGQVL